MNVNKTTGIFKGIKIYNQNSNLLMTELGDYTLRSNTSQTISERIITNISKNKILFKSNNGNLNLESDTQNLIIKSGTSTQNDFDLTNIDYGDITSDNYEFYNTNNNINVLYDTNEKILNLKNKKLLIESVDNDTTSGICLYSNNGINQIAHNNINIISDTELLLQSSNKINLTSLGFLTFNSEKLIGSIEEDIIILSSIGEIKFGGNGISTYGMQINNNLENNYISVGFNNDNKAS